MAVPVVVLVLCAVLTVLSWRRSGGSLTRYRLYTGAPIVWLLLGTSAAAAVLARLAGGPDLSSGLVTGGVLGAGLALAVLARRDGSDAPR